MTGRQPAGREGAEQTGERPLRAHHERDAPPKLSRKVKKSQRTGQPNGRPRRPRPARSAADSTDRVKITDLASPADAAAPGGATGAPGAALAEPDRPSAAEPDRPGSATSAAAARSAAPAAEASPAAAAPQARADAEPFGGDAGEPAERWSARHAFDLLYVRHAGPIGQQCYLLCGDRDRAARAVAHAFRLAWERWPEVAVDRDPPSWVRAAAYEYALSPWHRLRPAVRRPRVRDGAPENQRLLDALLALPPSYRRTLVLHDGLGLGLPDTAAEVEATTAATAARLHRAHRVLADRVPRLAEAPPTERGELLGALLEQLTASQPIRPLPAALARRHSERATRRRLAAAVALIGLLVSAVAANLLFGG